MTPKPPTLFLMLYAGMVLLTGFITLAFQLVMWFYVAKFVGIPTWIWGGFAIFSALILIFSNATKKEFKEYVEVLKRSEATYGS